MRSRRRRTDFLTNRDDNKIHSPRAFTSLIVGHVTALVTLQPPEEKERIAAELAELVRLVASLYGATLESVSALPEPPGWKTLTETRLGPAVVSFYGTLAAASAPGVQEIACRALQEPSFWKRVLPVITDPIGHAQAMGSAVQDGMDAMGIVLPPTKEGA